jgi:glycosyltransferase involved in cell wall biosynthesis
MENRPLISIVSPVYRAEKIIDELVSRLVESLSAITQDFEIVLVEDGSPDGSWQKIEENCKANAKLKGIKLSRNYGQHYAISAGLAEAAGDYVIVMDCDLQDDPKYIGDLYRMAKEGNGIVYTVKKERKHSFFKNITARFFYLVFNSLTDNKNAAAVGTVGSYSILSRQVVDAFNQIKDYHRHYLMVLRLLGYKSAYLTVEHQNRFEGRSSYNLGKLINHAIDGITSQTDKLLRISVTIGFIMFLVSFLGAIILLLHYLISGVATQGYTSLMEMLLASTGLILMSLGITGIYIGKIFDQVKGRPLYLVEKRVNM